VSIGQDLKKLGATAGMGANGQPRSNSFVADIRPKYAGVNFTWAKYGAACSYGRSHFILEPRLGQNSVFCPRDSFGVEARSQLGTYFNMYPILVHCAEYVLKQILTSARNRTGSGAPSNAPDMPIFYHEINKGGDNSKGSEYIEAILHTEILFSRDIKEVRIASYEIKDTGNGDVKTGKTWIVTKETIEQNLAAFLQQHGLQGKVVRF
jgi:hypothetical protein